jgi:hypothetical protein
MYKIHLELSANNQQQAMEYADVIYKNQSIGIVN